MTVHQYEISALVSQTSFRRETVCGVMKCQLFSQATAEQAPNSSHCLWQLYYSGPVYFTYDCSYLYDHHVSGLARV